MIYYSTKRLILSKIAEIEIFFKQKLITDLTILNKWKSFSEIIDKWRELPEDYIISLLSNFHKSPSWRWRIWCWWC